VISMLISPMSFTLAVTDPLLVTPVGWWIVVAWFFFLGSCIGSFMNVVIYRLPEGKSISHPGSHCPICGHAIRGRDNIPILSWLILRAKCRDCQVRIPARYPAVEFAVAVAFLVFAITECLSGGANLPGMRDLLVADEKSPLFDLAGAAWGITAYHLVLICTLICLALIDWDGKRAPLRLLFFPVAVGLLCPAVWPELRPIGAMKLLDDWRTVDSPAGRVIAGLGDGLFGLAAGVCAGRLLQLLPTKSDLRRRAALLASLLIGIYLGWQAVITLVVAVAMVDQTTIGLSGRWSRFRRISTSLLLAVAAGFWILVWKEITNIAW